MGTLWQDVKYGARMLRRSPGFTLTALLTLALGIGANTAFFSVVDAVLLRPLPFPEPQNLAQVVIEYSAGGVKGTQDSLDGATWEAVRDHSTHITPTVFSGLASGVGLAASDSAFNVRQQRVSAGFFRVLGIQPLLGREFSPEEDVKGGPAVVVLSFGLWKRLYAGDPSAMGRKVLLKGEPYTIVGVMPGHLRLVANPDLWTPLRPSKSGEGGGANYTVIARLRPNVTWAQADSQVAVIGRQVIRPGRDGSSAALHLVPLQSGLAAELREPLLILWGAVGGVLLIGCVNVAGLLLARGAARKHEVAVRMAVGGQAGRIVRQFMVESILLALLGGLLGAALGYTGVTLLQPVVSEVLGIWQTIAVDLRVLLFTCALSVLTSVLFGLYPAREATRMDIQALLVEKGNRAAAGGRRRWPRRLLIGAEVAMAVVLLVSAGLLIRTVSHLTAQNPGFDPRNVIAGRISLDDARYASRESINRLFEQSLERIRRLPEVESAAVGLHAPYERWLNMPFQNLSAGKPVGERQITTLAYITPEYFSLLRIPVLRGRTFQTSDGPQSARVGVVNEAFVRLYLPSEEPLGHFISSGGPLEIVGVVGNVQQKPSWGNYGPLAPVPAVYIPASQVKGEFLKLVHTWFSPVWMVRTRGLPGTTSMAMQQAMREVDPTLPFASFLRMEDALAVTLREQRLRAALLSSFAGLALLLTAVGIAGLVANTVAQQSREVGIRLALGATIPQAMRAVALPTLVAALTGMALGTALCFPATRLLRSMVWGIGTSDPLTFTGALLLIAVVAVGASFGPALRVARMNPAAVLHEE